MSRARQGSSKGAANWPSGFRRAIRNWYRQHARKLPWRETRDPYAIWISETMLQQTQVATVIEYYHRFLDRFPTPQALAKADEQEVLQLWAGLGYYRRARQLHAAAKIIAQEHAGEFPHTFEAIRELPGIGRYTAGAIASFALDQPAPIVEANTQRLYSRLLSLEESPSTTASQRQLWSFAESLLPARSGAGELNQALIELGSQICTARKPRCQICPVRGYCRSYENGRQNEIPVRKSKTLITPLVHGAIVLESERQVLLRQNRTDEWWHGLWDFPRVELAGPQDHAVVETASAAPPPTQENWPRWLREAVHARFQLDCQPTEYLTTIRHAVTRYRITLHCYRAEFLAPKRPVRRGNSKRKSKRDWVGTLESGVPMSGLNATAGWRWVNVNAPDVPLTSTAMRLIAWLSRQPPRVTSERSAAGSGFKKEAVPSVNIRRS